MPLDLWSFAKYVYTQDGVEASCLALQANGADVCLVLSAIWLELNAVSCDGMRLAQLQSLGKQWQDEVIRPLRELRQTWKAAAQTDNELAQLRQQVQTLELHAEQTLLQRMELLSKTWPAGGTQTDWLEGLELSHSPQNRTALTNLRRAVSLL